MLHRCACLASRSIDRGGEKGGDEAAEGCADELEGVLGSAFAGFDDAGDGALVLCSDVGSVSAPDFAVDDGGLQGLLGTVVGGGNGRVEQEAKPFGGMMAEVAGEAVVGFVGAGTGRQVQQTGNEIVEGEDALGIGGHLSGQGQFFETVALFQRLHEQVDDLLREASIGCGLGFQ